MTSSGMTFMLVPKLDKQEARPEGRLWAAPLLSGLWT
jgi:hypothetical protein